MDIQKRIRDLMAERGWTDYRLAKEAGLAHSTIANMFHRNNAPTLPTLQALCDAFQVTMSQFFCEEGMWMEITEEQKRLYSYWSRLSEGKRQALLELIRQI